MKETYTDISITFVTPKQSNDYKYLLNALVNGSYYPLTAFRTKVALKKYLADFGLNIGKRKNHLNNTWSVEGTFSRVLVWNYEDFKAIKKFNPKYVLVSENGNKTIGLFLNKTLYVMNVNTDPFVKNSLLQNCMYKANRIRKNKYYSLFHK